MLHSDRAAAARVAGQVWAAEDDLVVTLDEPQAVRAEPGPPLFP